MFLDLLPLMTGVIPLSGSMFMLTKNIKSAMLFKDIFSIIYKGEIVSYVNVSLLLRQNCMENLSQIRELHLKRLILYDKIREETDTLFLRNLAEEAMEIEYQLQDLWNFCRDTNYIKFWTIPKCGCPCLDNEDRYPYGYYVVSSDCVLHGHKTISISANKKRIE